MVDLQQAESTVKNNVYEVKKFLAYLRKNPVFATTEDVRSYLSKFIEGYSPNTYANVLKTMKILFRDYLNKEHIVKTFKFPQKSIPLKTVPNKNDLEKFYSSIGNLKIKSVFLMLATSGRRLKEILCLHFEDLDLDNHIIKPTGNAYSSRTKRCWYSFFNQETEEVLKEYISKHQPKETLFPISKRVVQRHFDKVRRRTGVDITPKTLRDWFCVEMGELGVPDRYIDAFCGRVPKSILARHYTDYSPERLKRIYDKAELKVLS